MHLLQPPDGPDERIRTIFTQDVLEEVLALDLDFAPGHGIIRSAPDRRDQFLYRLVGSKMAGLKLAADAVTSTALIKSLRKISLLFMASSYS